MQIRTRLTLQFLFAVAPILLISFFVIYYSSATYRKKEFYERLEKKAITTCDLLIKVDAVGRDLLRVIDNTQKDHLYKENITVYNYLNKEIYTNNDTLQFAVSDSLIDEIRLTQRLEYRENEFEVLGMVFNDRFNRFVVIAGAEDKFGVAKLVNLRNTLIALFFVIVGITTLIGYLYASRALRPISAVIEKAERISASNLSERIVETGQQDEISRLINTFNNMLDRIEESFKVQRVFMAGASHELKNPLTAITSQLEVVQLKERTNDEYKQTIQSVFEDIKELNKLAVQLIDLGQISYERNDIPLVPVRFDEILNTFVELFGKKNPGYKINFRINHLPEDENKLMVAVNRPLLFTAFNNLAENACKFSPDNKVEVSLHADNKLVVSFIDQGAGISDDDKKLIFEPFYRSRKTAQTKGYGIGLALVAKIAALHNASVTIDDNPGGGTVFKLYFSHVASN